MARGASKSDARITPEVMNYNSISLPPKAVKTAEERDLTRAYNAIKKGPKESDILRAEDLKNKATALDSAISKLRAEVNEIDEKYTHPDYMKAIDYPEKPPRKWNDGVPEDIKAAKEKLLRERGEFERELQRVRNETISVLQKNRELEQARVRLNQTLPDLPSYQRDKERYYSIDDLKSGGEGKAHLAKIPFAKLSEVRKQLLRDAVSEAQLEGEDRGGFIGKVERTQEITVPSKNKTGPRTVTLEFKIEADVDYKNDPYGDSSTSVNGYRIFVRSKEDGVRARQDAKEERENRYRASSSQAALGRGMAEAYRRSASGYGRLGEV